MILRNWSLKVVQQEKNALSYPFQAKVSMCFGTLGAAFAHFVAVKQQRLLL